MIEATFGWPFFWPQKIDASSIICAARDDPAELQAALCKNILRERNHFLVSTTLTL
jgi:hypothetical protein